jgi:Fe-Mn family superoxide dismutase
MGSPRPEHGRQQPDQEPRMAVTLPRLHYTYDALEPVISAATMKLHHGVHHQGYVDKLNRLIKGTELDALDLDAIVKRTTPGVSAGTRGGPIFNAAAQAWNHAFFWNSLQPSPIGGGAQGVLAERLNADFGGEIKFATAFKTAALDVFGSGWVWLVADRLGLEIVATANADTPFAHGRKPLLVLDVWEHAYYLDYQSRRAHYVSGVVDRLLNWQFAERNFVGEEALAVR